MLAQIEDLQKRGKVDFESALRDINETTVASVPGAQCAGVTVLDNAGMISSLGATHPYAVELDDIQRDTKQGPCLSAAWTHHTIHIDDLTTEQRWPRYCQAALQQTPVRSVLSFRLSNHERSLTALNFYSQSSSAFDEESVEIGLIFAAHTTMAWNLMRREEQFRSALASRDVIGQAKGIIMERYKVDAVAAFELLKRLSQSSNSKLVDIAEQLVAIDHPPG